MEADPYEAAAIQAVRARLAEAREVNAWGVLLLTFPLQSGKLTGAIKTEIHRTEKLAAVPKQAAGKSRKSGITGAGSA